MGKSNCRLTAVPWDHPGQAMGDWGKPSAQGSLRPIYPPNKEGPGVVAVEIGPLSGHRMGNNPGRHAPGVPHVPRCRVRYPPLERLTLQDRKQPSRRSPGAYAPSPGKSGLMTYPREIESSTVTGIRT